MKKSVFAALSLFAVAAIISSCHTETVVCQEDEFRVNSVGFDRAKIDGTKVIVYVASTNTVIDSARAPQHYVGHDTFTLFTVKAGYDYKLRMNDSMVYFVNNITPSGIKTQDFTRGPLTGKKIGCIERIISLDVNGTRQNVDSVKYHEIYIQP